MCLHKNLNNNSLCWNFEGPWFPAFNKCRILDRSGKYFVLIPLLKELERKTRASEPRHPALIPTTACDCDQVINEEQFTQSPSLHKGTYYVNAKPVELSIFGIVLEKTHRYKFGKKVFTAIFTQICVRKTTFFSIIFYPFITYYTQSE